MQSQAQKLSTLQKALTINLDESKYGTIVEIGAGQEVARNFFNAGAAAGTIAKTMSAYDMEVSNQVYGRTERFVSRERLEQMLTKEYNLLLDRLKGLRSTETTFFSYAATVAARGYKKQSECHGWVGIRMQARPGEAPNDILMHVRMMDQENEAQCQALGVLGVNLIYGAYYLNQKPREIINGLLDNIESDRLEIDLIHFSGPAFSHIDNRLMNLQLIHSWATRAVMFAPERVSVVPREVMYKKPIFILRGSYKPPTYVHSDMIEYGMDQFAKVNGVDRKDTLILAEITMAELAAGGDKVNDEDFLGRIGLLNHMGFTVLVSDYLRYFRLRSWLRQYTDNHIAITLSVLDFNYLFDSSYYEGLEGGILEAMGKLFPDNTHIYVYPSLINDELVTLSNVKVPDQEQHLLEYLVSNKKLVACEKYNEENLTILTREISRKIAQGSSDWESCVPESTKEYIYENGLFGFKNGNEN